MEVSRRQVSHDLHTVSYVWGESTGKLSRTDRNSSSPLYGILLESYVAELLKLRLKRNTADASRIARSENRRPSSSCNRFALILLEPQQYL